MKSNEELLARARRAYERARLWRGVRAAAFVVPLMLASFGGCGRPAVSAFLAGVLAVLVTILVWRGGSAARAVGPGYLAGIVPLAIPLVVCPACDRAGVVGTIPLAACVVGGLASGAIVVYAATREREDRAAFVAAGGAIAALAGSLSCVVIGLGGVIAMAIGVALVAPLGLRSARAV